MRTVFIFAPRSVHTDNFLNLIESLFDEIYVISSERPLFHSPKLHFYAIPYQTINPFRWWQYIQQIRQWIEVHHPDIIHIHQITRLAFFAVQANRPFGKPVISTAWGSDILVMPTRSIVHRSIVRNVLSHTNLLTADALDVIDTAKKICPSLVTQHILFPVEVPSFFTLEGKESIIYSNRMHTDLYNIDRILAWFAQFCQCHTGWRLIIAGDGEQRHKLVHYAHELGIDNHVRFVGWLNAEENKQWYRKARIYVSVPDSDGMSVSVLEAMAYGCQLILSDIPVNRSLLAMGVHALLTRKHENPLLTFIPFGTDQLRANYEYVKNNASPEALLDKWRKIYNAQLK